MIAILCCDLCIVYCVGECSQHVEYNCNMQQYRTGVIRNCDSASRFVFAIMRR
jgi:hypothetical protein